MKKILIASGNHNKITEIKYALKDIPEIELLSLKYFGIKVEVTEDGDTLEKNSFKKAEEIFNIFKIPSLSDDSGLFVDAINGEPGIFSARYAGENASYEDNCNKLLLNLENIPSEKRDAYFETVICFYINKNEYYFFKGICKGKIISEFRGENGFGYDPLFIPDGHIKTFAEMPENEKNLISHRVNALKEFRNFLMANKNEYN